jgi:hypothetical protein
VVQAVPIGDKTDVEKAKENVEIVVEKRKEKKHGNRSRVIMGNDNAKNLFFDLLNTTLRRALKYDDIEEYDTAEGGIGYEVMVRTKAAAQRAKTRWEKNGGYASFNESAGKLELSTTPLLGQKWKYKESADGTNRDSVERPSRILSSLIPLSQLQVTRENPEAYSDSIETLNEKVNKIPKLYSGENIKEHPIALHYFAGSTDIYVTEWDGKDTFFGYTILNGDTQNAEWGYSSLSDIMSVPAMNLDYDTDLGTVEEAIKRRGERELEAEAHRNRSQAMMGNENAKKDGITENKTPEKRNLTLELLNATNDLLLLDDAIKQAKLKGDKEKVNKLQSQVKKQETYQRKIRKEIDDGAKGKPKTDNASVEKEKARIKDINARLRELEKSQKSDYNMAKQQDKLDEDILAAQHRAAGKAKQKEIDKLRREKVELEISMPKTPKEPKAATNATPDSVNIETDTIGSFNKKYNLNIPLQSLPVWKATGWNGKINMAVLSETDKDFVNKKSPRQSRGVF